MYESQRTFKVWDYNVSHKQLLLRSPLTNGEINNIDIVFWGVEFISIPTIMDGLVLRKLTMVEVKDHPITRIRTSSLPLFGFGKSAPLDFVMAAGCKVLVNQLEIFDSSLIYADRDRVPEEYGTVLVML